MKKISIFLILAFSVGCKKKDEQFLVEKYQNIKNELISGGGATSFTRRLTLNSSIELWSVKQTPDGGYLCTGLMIKDQIPESFLLRLNSNGEILFQKKIPRRDFGAELESTSDGCFILANTFNTVNTAVHNAAWLQAEIIKINPEGDELWRKSYAISAQHRLTSVKQASDHGLILAGLQQNGEGFLIKTDASGNELWRKNYANFTIKNVNATTDNGFVLCGQRKTTIDQLDAYLVRTDDMGTVLWSDVLTESGNYYGSIAHCVTEAADGSIAIGGVAYKHQSSGFFRLYNPNGLELWRKSTDTLQTGGEYLGNQPMTILSTHDGQLIFTDSRGYMRRMILTGEETWIRQITSSFTEEIVSCSKTADNGFIMVGGNSQAWLVKTDAAGN